MNIVKILFALLTAAYFLGLSPAASLQAYETIEQTDSLVAHFTDVKQEALNVSPVLLPKGNDTRSLPSFLITPNRMKMKLKGFLMAPAIYLEPRNGASGFLTLEQFHSNYL
ncbi:hypothetical protein [Halobacillus halophilus]|uniref:hypothetical protein n=1 Tax=Halobacillus halophilus TaxID=1570 RepID=UPI001CD74E6F|nr:hypothetical protein [Halobacillus halophilus]MCA1011658.1 hypothetical protein [Halobacillus halophilus]